MNASLRRVLAAAVPAAVVVAWSLKATAEGIVPPGVLLWLSTPITLVVAWGLVRGGREVSRGLWSHAPALAAGAVATAAYWLRVWSRRYPEETGIFPFLFNLLGFWWPALVVAMVAIVIERWMPRGTVSRFGPRVLAGLAGGVAGMFLFFAIGATWFGAVDRYALADDVELFLDSRDFTHNGRELRVALDGSARSREPAFQRVQWAEHIRMQSLELTKRKDVFRVRVDVRSDGTELFRVEATEADRAVASPTPPPIDRGPLDRASLDRMARPFLDPRAADPFAEWSRRFRADVAADEVSVAFEPPGPADRDTAEWYSAGWESANEIVAQTNRYFPEIARVRVSMPNLQTVVERQQATGRLQSSLLPAERVLGLSVREGGRGDEPLDPGRFAGELGPGFQVAVVRQTGKLWSKGTGWLYEGIRLTPGMLYVLEVSDDATARLVLQLNDGTVHGPVVIPPGGRTTLAGEEIASLGWVPRASFRVPGPPAP